MMNDICSGVKTKAKGKNTQDLLTNWICIRKQLQKVNYKDQIKKKIFSISGLFDHQMFWHGCVTI